MISRKVTSLTSQETFESAPKARLPTQTNSSQDYQRSRRFVDEHPDGAKSSARHREESRRRTFVAPRLDQSRTRASSTTYREESRARNSSHGRRQFRDRSIDTEETRVDGDSLDRRRLRVTTRQQVSRAQYHYHGVDSGHRQPT